MKYFLETYSFCQAGMLDDHCQTNMLWGGPLHPTHTVGGCPGSPDFRIPTVGNIQVFNGEFRL